MSGAQSIAAEGGFFQAPMLTGFPQSIVVAVYRRRTVDWLIRLSATGTLFQVAWGSPFPGDAPVTLPLRPLLYP